MRKMKRDIWISCGEISSKKNDKTDVLPIVVTYNKIGTELARSWKNIIGQGELFDDDNRLITAYCNGPNLRRKKLVRS